MKNQSASKTAVTRKGKEKPVKKNLDTKMMESKKKSKKESESKPKLTSKIAKILSDMFSNKTAKFIKLHQAGLSTSAIVSLTGGHPSFVHGVISRFKAKKK